MNKKVKFGIGIAIILAVVVWEGISGFRQSESYYVTVSQLTNGSPHRLNVRVGGLVAPGSISRLDGTLTFRLSQGKDSIPVTYVGTATLPDTFKDGAQAIIQGDYMSNGMFRAENVQAKCSSKYKAMPNKLKGAESGSSVADLQTPKH